MSTGDVIDRAVRLYRRNFTALIAIVAVPALIGYMTSLSFSFGYAQLVTAGVTTGSSFPAVGLVFVLAGMAGYPLWFFIQVTMLTGLARTVGDHVMLGETITLKKCLSVVRRRLGDIALMTLLSFAVLVLLSVVFFVVFFVLIMMIAFLVGITAAAGTPPWVAGVVLTIVAIAALLAGTVLLLIVVSRIVFLPQVLILEGQTAGSALGRSIKLGAKNWYRVGAIMLFTYFITLSLLAAFSLPAALVLGWMGVSPFQFLTTPGGDALYSAFSQIANLLTMPIWAVSFTLLYFDNRVRKEGYDLDLLAREVAPGFEWRAPVEMPVPIIPPATVGPGGRPYVQSGPLGLGGYYGPQTPVTVVSRVNQELTAIEVDHQASPPSAASCKNCGTPFHPGARFCVGCGTVITDS
jgi:hypothetical protein